MKLWTSLKLTLATGPAIASPELDTFTLARADTSARKVKMIDRLLAKGAASPPARRIIPEATDTRHRSFLTVVYDDASTEDLRFAPQDASEDLLALVALVRTRSPARGKAGKA